MKHTLITLILATRGFCALTAANAIEVRPTVGAATNGCGFTTGASGTDMSQFNNKNAAACSNCQSSTVNISTTDAVAAGTTTITSATANFSAAIVGNVVFFSGGTGSIANQWRQVTAFTSALQITIDASIAASTGMTMNIGGSCDHIATALLFNVAGNKIFVKNSGTESTAVTISLNASTTPDRTHPYNELSSYNTTRGDCSSPQTCPGRTTVQLTATSKTALDASGPGAQGWLIQGFLVDCNSQTASNGIKGYIYAVIYNNKVTNCTTDGIYVAQNDQSLVFQNEVTGGVSGCSNGINANGSGGNMIVGNWVHDNGCVSGISLGSHDNAILNVVSNTTGGTHAGISLNGNSMAVMFNTVYASAGAGIDGSGTVNFGIAGIVRGNLLVNNAQGLFGSISSTTCGWAALPWYDGNAYQNNTTNRKCVDDTGTVNAINAAAPYTNVLDVTTPSTTPFTSAGTNDFSLNNTATGGKLVRATSWPGSFLGLTPTGFMDFGALQAQASAGGSNSAYAQ